MRAKWCMVTMSLVVAPASGLGAEVISAEGIGESAAAKAPATQQEATIVDSDSASALSQKAGPEAESEKAERFYVLRGDAQYRMLALTDEDPANGMQLLWKLRGDLRIAPGTRAFVWIGMTEKFVAEPEESGFLLQDTQIGLQYDHPLSLAFLGIPERQLEFRHYLRAYVPTSRASLKQDLYLAPEIYSRAKYQALAGLDLTLDANVQYRFHRYAERAGLEGGMNRRLVCGVVLGAEYTLYEHPPIGSFTVGVDGSTSWIRKYGSREEYETPMSSAGLWLQDYGWDVYASYSPFDNLSVVLSLEQGSSVLRDGIVNVNFLHRDETELVLWVVGVY